MTTERYHSPQINTQSFQNFRQRLLKPKKPGSNQEKDYVALRHAGCASGDRNEAALQQHITVGLLNTDPKSHQKTTNSASAASSICSVARKEGKKSHACQQKMLSNI